jgi:hypothetical protein
LKFCLAHDEYLSCPGTVKKPLEKQGLRETVFAPEGYDSLDYALVSQHRKDDGIGHGRNYTGSAGIPGRLVVQTRRRN